MKELSIRDQMIKTVLTAYWGDMLVCVDAQDVSGKPFMFYLQDCGELMTRPTFGYWSDLWNDELFADAPIEAILDPEYNGFQHFTRSGFLELIACIDHGGCPSWFKEGGSENV